MCSTWEHRLCLGACYVELRQAAAVKLDLSWMVGYWAMCTIIPFSLVWVVEQPGMFLETKCMSGLGGVFLSA